MKEGHINLWHAGWFILALCVAALVVESFWPLSNKDLLAARAAMQEAQWKSLELQDQIDTQSKHYGELVQEFSEYQNLHVCVAKKP
jgi:hypothetical protein